MNKFKNISKKNEIIYFFKKNNKKRILIISGRNSYYKSGAKNLINKINFLSVKILLKKNFYPETKELKYLLKETYKFKPDLIIAIGGGSVLDYSKIINILKIEDLNNLEKKIKNNLFQNNSKNFYLIAIPTTAGSGAEVTSNAVMYINKKKYSFEGKNLVPDKYFLCPDFLIKNPKKIKASSGFDAISQSVESILSLKSNNMSLSYAKQSLGLSINNFINFVKKPNYENRSKMIISAHFSGKAISISKTIAPHAVSYPFTSYYGISHGHAVSINLEKFLFFNFKNLNQSDANFNLNHRFKILFSFFNVKNINDLCSKISYIKKNANLQDDYKKLGININKDIDKITNGVNILRLKNNPVKLNKNDLKNIILNNTIKFF